MNYCVNENLPADSRIIWIDVLKGLGIIAVVWGHSGNPYAYLMFFFHMPLFFFMSGYLYKQHAGKSWLQYTGKKIKHLLIPYLFYLISITLLLMILSLLKNQPVTADWKTLLMGGSSLAGVYGTFWFVTCLFFVQIFYDFLCRKIHSNRLRIIMLVACYFLAYWESRFHQDVFLLWNIDVVLFAIIFYALGNLCRFKKWFENPRIVSFLTVFSLIITVTFFTLYFMDIIRFGLDLKHRQYYFFGTNVLVPMSMIILLSVLSIKVAKSGIIRKITSSLGESSMSIMYLHQFSNFIAGHLVTITPLWFLITGLLLPWLWNKIASNMSLLRFLALGSSFKHSRGSTFSLSKNNKNINLP